MFEQKYENYQMFSSERFHFSVVKFVIYLNSYVFVMVFVDFFHKTFDGMTNIVDPD